MNNQPSRSPKKRLQELQEQLEKFEKIESLKKQQEDALNTYRQQVQEYQSNRPNFEYIKMLDTIPSLSFRLALEQTPSLVTRIRGDIYWLRAIILIYGGVNDQGLAKYLLQYKELSTIVMANSSIRMHLMENARKKTWWNEEWNDKEDLFYHLSVYLDTQGSAMSYLAKKSIPVFQAELIYNDSPLTPIFLQALQNNQRIESIQPLLWKQFNSASDAMARAHALAVLLVTDSQKALQSLHSTIANPAMAPVMDMLFKHLEMRAQVLKDAVVLLTEQHSIGATINKLPIDDPQYVDLAELLFDLYTTVQDMPVKADEYVFQLQNHFPYFNAEVWAYWLSGKGSDDPKYSLAVVLDTQQKKLQSLTALQNLHLASNVHYGQLITWNIEPIPLILTDTPDIVGEALTTIQKSQSGIIEDLFHTSLIISLGIDYKEQQDLFKEICIVTIFLPLKSRQYIFDLIIPEEIRNQPFHIVQEQFIRDGIQVQNPTIRARIFWRIAQGGVRLRNINIWEAVIAAAHEIHQPLQRALAFERMINDIPFKYRQLVQTEAERSANQISDINNRVRMLVRLARYYTNEDQEALLKTAVDDIPMITDERARMETLALIRPFLNDFEKLVQRVQQIAGSFHDEWLKLKAQNILSVKLLQLHSDFAQAENITPIILYAHLRDILALNPSSLKHRNYWEELCHQETHNEAKKQLMKLAAQDEEGTLIFTADVLKTITTLLQDGNISYIHPILPYIRTQSSEFFPIFRAWLETRPDMEIWQYAGLMLAENGQFDIETVQCIISILEVGMDLGRYRASLVLHGNKTIIGKHNRQYRSSSLGFDIQFLLAEAEIRFKANIGVASAIYHTQNNIYYDDDDNFQKTVQILAKDNSIDSPAYKILSGLDLLEPSLYEPFFQAFLDGNDSIKKAILRSWSMLSLSGSDFGDKNFRVPPQFEEQIQEMLNQLPAEVLDVIRVIPNRAFTLATVIEEVLHNTDSTSGPSQILYKKSWAPPQNSVLEISAHIGYYYLYDPKSARDAADKIAQTPKGIELLFTWLTQMLQASIEDANWYEERSTLLEVAAAVAAVSPAAVFTLIEEYHMEPLITQAALFNRAFWGRSGAVTLMGYMIHIPENFVDVLITCLQDVPPVQTAALQMVRNLRYFDHKLTPKLIELLNNKNASIAYAASQILTVIGRNNKCPQNVRRDILGALADATRDVNAEKGVFVFEEKVNTYYIQNISTLHNAYFRSILDITNIM